MNTVNDERDGPLLDRSARSLLRDVLGDPGRDRASAAIEEVERQVAMEDLLILMVRTAQEASVAFFDLVAQVADPLIQPQPADDPNRPPGDRRHE